MIERLFDRIFDRIFGWLYTQPIIVIIHYKNGDVAYQESRTPRGTFGEPPSTVEGPKSDWNTMKVNFVTFYKIHEEMNPDGRLIAHYVEELGNDKCGTISRIKNRSEG